METILHSLNGILTILIMIIVGFILEKRCWFEEKSITLISRLVTQVCLPTYMLANIITNFDHNQLINLSTSLPIPLISMLTGYFISKLLSKVFFVPKGRQGIFSTCVCFSNTIFIGLPLTIALFGEEAVPYIMIYYMVNTSLFWTVGVYEIASDATENKNYSFFNKETIKNIFSLPLMGFMIGVVFVIFEINLPQPVFQACRYIGSMTTPLAMLFIGIAMSKTSWAEIKFDRILFVSMVGRYFICPFIVMGLNNLFDVNTMMGNIFIIMAAMPAMTNTSIVAKAYDSDYRYAAMLTAVSTVLAVMIIPFYMWVIYQ